MRVYRWRLGMSLVQDTEFEWEQTSIHGPLFEENYTPMLEKIPNFDHPAIHPPPRVRRF